MTSNRSTGAVLRPFLRPFLRPLLRPFLRPLLATRRTGRRLLVAVLVLAGLTLAAPAGATGTAVPAPAGPDDNTHPTVTSFRSSTYMVGDSLTAGGKPDLQKLRAWDIDGYPGRNVAALPDYLRLRLASPMPLRKVVVALGTNAVAGWDEASYRDALALLPATTVVVLVTTYRDPTVWRAPEVPDLRREAWVQWHYSADMQRIAATRPHTCLVPWRSYASAHRTLLRDGTHPTWAGHLAWARLVSTTAAACH